MTGLDEQRVVRLRTPPLVDTGPPWRFGSGYLIATRRVLTACHVLMAPDSEEQPRIGDLCEVLAWPCEDEDGWLPGQVLWVDPDHDVAVVLAQHTQPVSTVPFGRLEGPDVVAWQAIGFPLASLGEEGRQAETAFGTTSSIGGRGRLALTVESRSPAAREDDESGWAGLSGAAVFCGERLIGVIRSDPHAWQRSLDAVGLVSAVADKGFGDAVGEALVIDRASSLGALDWVLDRLPPAIADRGALDAYLMALHDELDQDPWTHLAGGSVSSVMRIGRPLPVHARADRGYGAVMSQIDGINDADGLVDGCQRLVVLGGPGSGKTWLARRSAIRAADAARRALAAGADPNSIEIPVFARCAIVFESQGGAWEAVVNAAMREVGHLLGTDRAAGAIRRRLLEHPGRYLVVLDGLDEAEHLPADDVLNRLINVAGRELRIVLTTRPGSWRRQLLLEDRPEHRLADLQPLRYPEDVHAVIRVLLGDRPEASDRLIALLDGHPDLAEASATPLLCTMYCLLADSGQPLPPARSKLYERIVTRLLQSTWHHLKPTPSQRTAARAALQALAWVGAADDPATGLGAWPEAVASTGEEDLAEPVLVAVSHVAPAVEHDPDEAQPRRRFLHRSVREHLVAEHLATLPPDVAAGRIEPHLWYDPEWQHVVPAAVAAHPHRSDLLRWLVTGNLAAQVSWQDVSRRDGFGELRRLLARLATETSPRDWDKDLAPLIDAASRGLPAAANGWPGARPNQEDVSRLHSGDVPWPPEQVRAWVYNLDLGDTEKQALVQSLIEVLRQNRRLDNVEDFRWQADVATVLDALEISPTQRAEALRVVTDHLQDRATSVKARAYRALAHEPAPGELIQAVLGQLEDVEDAFNPGYRAVDLGTALDVLGADEAARRHAVALLLDRFATLDEDLLVDVVRRLGTDDAQRARAIDLMLNRFGGRDSYETRAHMAQIEALLPDGSTSGGVLRHLVANGGPWESTAQAHQVLKALALHVSEEDRHAAVDAAVRRIDTATGWPVHWWAEHLTALQPTTGQREEVVERLLARLPQTRADRVGFVALPVRVLGGSNDQRRRLVRHIADQLQSVDQPAWLLEMATWFSPVGAERSTIVSVLIDTAASLPANNHAFLNAANALELSNVENAQLINALIEHLRSWSAWNTLELTKAIASSGTTKDQRTTAAQMLLHRLSTARSLSAADLLLEALMTLEPTADERRHATRTVLPLVLDASPRDLRYPVWTDLLPDLLEEEDKQRVIDALSSHLTEAPSPLNPLKLLEALEPNATQHEVINERLLTRLAAEKSPFKAGEIGGAIARRRPTEEQRSRMLRHLLQQVRDCDSEAAAAELVSTMVQVGLDDNGRADAATAILRHAEAGHAEVLDSLLELEPLDKFTRRRALDLAMGRLSDGSYSLTDSELQRLTMLGLDASAIGDFAARSTSRRSHDVLVRQLAGALRHKVDLTKWRAALEAWADIDERLYGGAGRQ